MLEIPLRATANQALQVVLDGQPISLRLYTRTTADHGDRLYCDLDMDQRGICYGVPCLDGLPLPLYRYQALRGKLVFVDMQGADDPHWSGLGSRFKLLWLNPVESIAYARGTL